MINFLRITNRIKIGDYLHSNGAINDVASSDIIGLCVIPSEFLPDGYARFLSLEMSYGPWSASFPFEDEQIRFKEDYYKALPNADHQKPMDFGFLIDPDLNPSRKIVSPFLPDESFNPEFLKDIDGGNIFKSYKGYEITKYYREQYNLEKKKIPYIFKEGFKRAPTYRKEEWYLPSIGELIFVFGNIKTFNHIREKYHSKDSLAPILTSDYWSSSEGHPDTAWFVGMEDGFVGENRKTTFKLISKFLIL